MSEEERLELPVHFARRGGRNVLVHGERPAEPAIVTGKLARVTCLMAIAIHFDQLISEGAIADFSEIARVESSGDADTESAVAGTRYSRGTLATPPNYFWSRSILLSGDTINRD